MADGARRLFSRRSPLRRTGNERRSQRGVRQRACALGRGGRRCACGRGGRSCALSRPGSRRAAARRGVHLRQTLPRIAHGSAGHRGSLRRRAARASHLGRRAHTRRHRSRARQERHLLFQAPSAWRRHWKARVRLPRRCVVLPRHASRPLCEVPRVPPAV